MTMTTNSTEKTKVAKRGYNPYYDNPLPSDMPLVGRRVTVVGVVAGNEEVMSNDGSRVIAEAQPRLFLTIIPAGRDPSVAGGRQRVPDFGWNFGAATLPVFSEDGKTWSHKGPGKWVGFAGSRMRQNTSVNKLFDSLRRLGYDFPKKEFVISKIQDENAKYEYDYPITLPCIDLTALVGTTLELGVNITELKEFDRKRMASNRGKDLSEIGTQTKTLIVEKIISASKTGMVKTNTTKSVEVEAVSAEEEKPAGYDELKQALSVLGDENRDFTYKTYSELIKTFKLMSADAKILAMQFPLIADLVKVDGTKLKVVASNED